MDALRVCFIGCVVLAALCVAGAFAAVSDNLGHAAVWFVAGAFVFGFSACLVKMHAEARNG